MEQKMTTGVRNIYQTKSGTFKIMIKHQGKQVYCGCFKTIEQAQEMLPYFNNKYKRKDYVILSNSHKN